MEVISTSTPGPWWEGIGSFIVPLTLIFYIGFFLLIILALVLFIKVCKRAITALDIYIKNNKNKTL